MTSTTCVCRHQQSLHVEGKGACQRCDCQAVQLLPEEPCCPTCGTRWDPIEAARRG